LGCFLIFDRALGEVKEFKTLSSTSMNEEAMLLKGFVRLVKTSTCNYTYFGKSRPIKSASLLGGLIKRFCLFF